MNEKINLNDKFGQFNQHWTPKIVGEVNDSYLLLAKLQGEFVWHRHAEEDEMFLVVKGRLQIKLRDQNIDLAEGEIFIVPKNTEHLPVVADGEAHVLLLEPKTTRHTGDLVTGRTVTNYERI